MKTSRLGPSVPRFHGDIPSRTGVQVSHPIHCPVVGLCTSSHLLQEELSLIMAERDTHWSMSEAEMSLEVILLLCSLNRTIVFGFPQAHGLFGFQILGHPDSVRHQAWVLWFRVDLKPNQTVVGYSYSVGATIVPAYHTGRSPRRLQGSYPS